MVIGYSVPQADDLARQPLLESNNKGTRLTICCGAATGDGEEKFRNAGFDAIRQIDDPSFDGYLVCEGARARFYEPH